MSTGVDTSQWVQLSLLEFDEEPAVGIAIAGEPESVLDWVDWPTGWEGKIWEDSRTFYTVMSMFDFEADRKGWELYEVRLQRKPRGDMLAVMKARKDRKKVVAFVGGSGFYDLMRELANTKRREGFIWHLDKYSKPNF